MDMYVKKELSANDSPSSGKYSETTGTNLDSIEDSSTTVSGDDNDRVENRLYVVSRSGSGEAMYMKLDDDLTDFLSYKVKIEQWPQIKDLVDFGVAQVRNNIFIIGGYDRITAKITNRVHRFDVSELRWTECSPMHFSRCKFGVAVADNCIYVSGGERNGGKATGSCEMYDLSKGLWVKYGMLISPRFNHSCLAYGKEIYCAGGCFGGRNQDNLWIYEQHKWSELDSDYPQRLPATLDRMSTISVNGTFYFIGGVGCRTSYKTGKKKFSTENSVFSYRASVSSASHNFTEASDLLTPWNYRHPSLMNARHNAGTAVIGNKIYVIGGSNLESTQPVRIVEYFDFRKGRWEEDFRIRKGDVSNVVCAILKVPKIPESQRRQTYKLKWVLW